MTNLDFTKTKVPLSKFPDCCLACEHSFRDVDNEYYCKHPVYAKYTGPEIEVDNICPQFERIKHE